MRNAAQVMEFKQSQDTSSEQLGVVPILLSLLALGLALSGYLLT